MNYFHEKSEEELIKRIKAGQAPKPVYEAPGIDAQVVRYAAMKAGHAEKQANNFPIQSVGGSITKAALVALHSRGYKIINTVHDSICVSVPANEAVDRLPEFKAILESAYKLSVPLKADVKILNSLSEKDAFVPATAEKKNAA
jgi:DNA polymerase I-like protein with 3'-5' exonuclease and polymerase domains